jgi:hypothetical protein
MIRMHSFNLSLCGKHCRPVEDMKLELEPRKWRFVLIRTFVHDSNG